MERPKGGRWARGVIKRKTGPWAFRETLNARGRR